MSDIAFQSPRYRQTGHTAWCIRVIANQLNQSVLRQRSASVKRLIRSILWKAGDGILDEFKAEVLLFPRALFLRVVGVSLPKYLSRWGRRFVSANSQAV